MTKILPGLILFTFFFSASLLAQETLPLSLQDALDAALENNTEIVIARLEEEGAAIAFKQTNSAFLPQINLSYTAVSTNNPLNAFGFKLQQQSISQSDFNPDLLNYPSATQNFMTKAEWLQPVLNMDMVYMRKAANEQREIYAFKTKRSTEHLAFEVQKAYAQLQLAQQAKNVLEEALQSIDAIYTATNNRFEKGFLQKSDVLTVQVEVTTTESQLAEAKSNAQNAADYLSLLMGRKAGVIYKVDVIQQILPVENTDTEIPANRADFQAMQSAIAAQDLMIHSGKLSYLPKLNAFAEYLLNDKEAFGFSSNSYLVGAQLSWSLFNGMTTQSKIAEKRIERNKMTEQLRYQKAQSQNELNKTLRQIQDANFALQQHEIAVDQATEALRILQNRYLQGLVTTNDVLQSQTLLLQQKLKLAEVVFRFNTTYAYLQFLTSTSEK